MSRKYHPRRRFQQGPPQPEFGLPFGRVENRKALQLCSQIAETLTLVLSGECNDDLMRDLLVESVVPFPTAGRLLVTLIPAVSAGNAPLEDYLEHLEHFKGLLRSEVASAINRRKVPDLVFRILPAGDPRLRS
jgi:ribosome-binding factor A